MATAPEHTDSRRRHHSKSGGPAPAERVLALAAALGRQAARELFWAATGAPAVSPPKAHVAAPEEDKDVPERD